VAATNQDFDFYVGDNALVNIQIKTDDGKPKDIAGAKCTWKMIDAISCMTVTEKIIGNGVTITDGINGLLSISLATAETSKFSPGRYSHVATVTDLAGNVCTVTVGTLTVRSVP
jgi:hypothetical protein